MTNEYRQKFCGYLCHPNEKGKTKQNKTKKHLTEKTLCPLSYLNEDVILEVTTFVTMRMNIKTK